MKFVHHVEIDDRFTTAYRKRFFERIDIPDNTKKCWNWRGSYRDDGYGYMPVKLRGRDHYFNMRAHRYSWQYFNKASIIQDGVIMHECDKRACVNPFHLKLGTSVENTKDRDEKGRGHFVKNRGEKHPRAVLTKAVVLDARRRRAAGAKWSDLARDYNCSVTGITNAVTGVSWSWL